VGNRTLIELLHDESRDAEQTPAEDLKAALVDFLRSAGPRQRDVLRDMGIRVIDTQHTSESLDITWGGLKYKR
jgi:hypothetical protein